MPARVVETAAKDPDPLADLARAAAGGDRQAARRLIVAVGPAMVRAIRKVRGTAASDLEDIMQEAAHGLLQALRTFKGDCNVLHFACRVGVLSALTWRRRANLSAEWTADAPEAIDETTTNEPSPAEGVLAARRREALAMLLDELAPTQAEVLVLHCALGFTVEEIAAAVGRPAETIRSRLRLAKQALRHRIGASSRLTEILEVRR
jgi:RNA polymerase sigma-70 factor (ECF subfamily)